MTEAVEYYEDKQPGLGERFYSHVKETIERIQRFPEMYEQLKDGARRVDVSKFPYGVFYLFEDEVVKVFAVIHNSRHERHWQSRLSN